MLTTSLLPYNTKAKFKLWLEDAWQRFQTCISYISLQQLLYEHLGVGSATSAHESSAHSLRNWVRTAKHVLGPLRTHLQQLASKTCRSWGYILTVTGRWQIFPSWHFLKSNLDGSFQGKEQRTASSSGKITMHVGGRTLPLLFWTWRLPDSLRAPWPLYSGFDASLSYRIWFSLFQTQRTPSHNSQLKQKHPP